MSTVDQTTSTIDPDALRAISNEIAATCAGFNLRRASRAVSQHFDHALAPTGLRMTQFTLLGALAIGGSVTINDLARVLVIDRTTLTRNLRLLRTAGHVAATTNGTGREQRISLTEDGRETLARAVPLWRAAQDTRVERFDETRWPGLVADLDRLVEGAVGKRQRPGIQVTDASASRQEP
jgi:DNA-binding MarR family transcriptional regulator